MKDVEKCWDDKATQWKDHVGSKGDNNRIFNSDPVLWSFAGDVKDKVVLDAGCGTGYLSVLMAKKGASVIGVDVSSRMIEEARSHSKENDLDIDFRVESCENLTSVANSSIDLIVSNYALMDIPDLESTIQAFYRVLKDTGKAVLIFSHPCFDELAEDEMYFDELKKVDKWGKFDSDFIYFHRPLSHYWRVFAQTGFKIVDFDEPVAKDPFAEGFKDEWRQNYKKRPWSIAFSLAK